MNDLVKYLSLSKELSELLASGLNEKNLPHHGGKVTFYRRIEKGLLQYFRVDSDLVYCHVLGLLNAKGVIPYEPNEWQLFLDSLKRSLKCILRHNGSSYGSGLQISKKNMNTSKK